MNATANGVTARHSSETAEHYTPAHIVEAARTTLEAIDLDPFSCVFANRTVKAATWFNPQEGNGDGFLLSWHGRVFVNPPGGKSENQSNQKRAWFKLASEFLAGRVVAGVFVCFSVELLQTTQVKPTGPIPLDFPICYPTRRIAYLREDGSTGSSPPHSSCVILVSNSLVMVERFRQSFATIGRVVVPS